MRFFPQNHWSRYYFPFDYSTAQCPTRKEQSGRIGGSHEGSVIYQTIAPQGALFAYHIWHEKSADSTRRTDLRRIKDYPAGRAAVVLFRQISKGGSHEVRLLDVTGEPNNPKNMASDAFEETGVKEMKAGKDYYDEVVQKDGKSYLRAMTAVPVVMDKCIMCHENYKKAEKGEAIGAISYSIPLD
jgi:hypothetical protein